MDVEHSHVVFMGGLKLVRPFVLLDKELDLTPPFLRSEHLRCSPPSPYISLPLAMPLCLYRTYGTVVDKKTF
jgi:hypothetical protein